MTDAEQLLWQCLRGKQLEGFKFRRQHPIERFVLDFYCPSVKLAIELDGGQHSTEGGRASDYERTAYLKGMGIRVIRFWNHEVLGNLEGVLTSIWGALQEKCGQPADAKRTFSYSFPHEAYACSLPQRGDNSCPPPSGGGREGGQ